MLPEGVSLIGGSWETVLAEISETSACRCLLTFLQIEQESINALYGKTGYSVVIVAPYS